MFQKLKEKNQKLLDKNLSLEKEIEDLKFQVSASALIISEHESKTVILKIKILQTIHSIHLSELAGCHHGVPVDLPGN